MTTTDQLDSFLSERDRLPKRCPSWCEGLHVEALEEGCDFATASAHTGPDYSLAVRPHGGVEVTGGVHTQVSAQPREGGDWWDVPLIRLETYDRDRSRCMVPLTSGQARVLARQLLHLADLIDLD